MHKQMLLREMQANDVWFLWEIITATSFTGRRSPIRRTRCTFLVSNTILETDVVTAWLTCFIWFQRIAADCIRGKHFSSQDERRGCIQMIDGLASGVLVRVAWAESTCHCCSYFMLIWGKWLFDGWQEMDLFSRSLPGTRLLVLFSHTHTLILMLLPLIWCLMMQQ